VRDSERPTLQQAGRRCRASMNIGIHIMPKSRECQFLRAVSQNEGEARAGRDAHKQRPPMPEAVQKEGAHMAENSSCLPAQPPSKALEHRMYAWIETLQVKETDTEKC